jgi:23S rRNA (cytidine1920-2'-O)/16S rRNA (cytidine1409-2'-O)-methyltransferase
VKSFHRRSSRPAPKPAPAVCEPVVRHGGQRADQLLVERGLAPSRTVAQRMIEAGRVSWPEGAIGKASTVLPQSAELTVAEGDDDRYVSRGGLKLAGALTHAGIRVRGRTCLDVGQSTGGFTDCLLQTGAERVVGIDVGHDQLHHRLRDDPRVTCVEGINARAIGQERLPHAHFDLIVADLSFISLTLVLPQLPPLLAAGGDMLLLVKPQFEVGAANVGKGGIVRDSTLYPQVEAKLREAAASVGLTVCDYFDSPITGTDGNREFFIWTQHDH